MKVAALLAGAAIAFPSVCAQAAQPFKTRTTTKTVSRAVDDLKTAIEKAGATVFAIVDHAGGAEKAGLSLEPTTLVIFGNPKMGTPLMQADPLAGFDLPVKMLVYSRNGQTTIAALDPAAYVERYNVPADAPPLGAMGKALDNLMKAAAE